MLREKERTGKQHSSAWGGDQMLEGNREKADLLTSYLAFILSHKNCNQTDENRMDGIMYVCNLCLAK